MPQETAYRWGSEVYHKSDMLSRFTLSYNVREAFRESFTLSYNVREAFSESFTLSYNVRGLQRVDHVES